MSEKDLQDRISQLVANATKVANAGNLQKAYESLKEASHLDSENAQVKDAIVSLQAREQTGDALNLVKSYLDKGNEDDGQRALLALRQKQLPQANAIEVLDLLLNSPGERGLLDVLTGALLYKSIHARKEIAKKFSEPITAIFTELFERGVESFKSFASIPLDESAWTSKDLQKTAQIDLFRLCVAKLIDCDCDHPARLMQVIARQLAVAPDNVKDLIDFEVFRVILEQLDIRLDAKLRSQAMLATSKVLESTGETGEQIFGQFLVTEVAKQTNDDLITAFSAAAAIFPMVPAVAAQLFMTDGFVQQLVPNLERNSEAAAQGQR